MVYVLAAENRKLPVEYVTRDCRRVIRLDLARDQDESQEGG